MNRNPTSHSGSQKNRRPTNRILGVELFLLTTHADIKTTKMSMDHWYAIRPPSNIAGGALWLVRLVSMLGTGRGFAWR